MEHGMKEFMRLAIVAALAGAAVCSCKHVDPDFVVSRKVIEVRVSAADTKAMPVIDSRNLEEGTNINSLGFSMAAYAEDEWFDNDLPAGTQGANDKPNAAGLYFQASASYSSASGWALSKTSGTGDTYWINDVPITFWSWAPSSAVNSPAASASSFGFSKTLTAGTAGEDVVVACNKSAKMTLDDSGNIASTSGIDSHDSNGGAINVVFNHAMAKINFIVCADDNSFDSAHLGKVKTIGLSGIMNSGDCSVAASTTVDNVVGSPTVSWTVSSSATAESFSQTYGAVSNDDLWVTKEYNKAAGSSDKISCRLTRESLFMIPQTIAAGAKVTMTFDGDSKVYTADLPADKWEPGKTYTYKLKLAPAAGSLLKLSVMSWNLVPIDGTDDDATVDVVAVQQADGAESGENVKFILNKATREGDNIYVKSNGSVELVVNFTKPVGGSWDVSMNGDFSAFKFLDDSDHGNIGVSNPESSIYIAPDVPSPILNDYTITLSFTVKTPDGQFVDATSAVFGTHTYKIIILAD